MQLGIACATRHGFSVESTASGIMSEKFIALKVNVHYSLMFFYLQFLLLPSIQQLASYSQLMQVLFIFANYLRTFVFVSTCKCSKIHCQKGVRLEVLLVLKRSSFEKSLNRLRQKNELIPTRQVINNANKSSFRVWSQHARNNGPAVQVGSVSAISDSQKAKVKNGVMKVKIIILKRK